MERVSKEKTFLQMAQIISKRATCIRRQVGCILINEHNHIIGSGYNGVAAGMIHCIDTPCKGAQCESGTGLDLCEAIHAEANAILQCKNVHEITEAYVTTCPCVHCIKLLLNTSCHSIYYINDYATSDATKEIWERAGRHIEKYYIRD